MVRRILDPTYRKAKLRAGIKWGVHQTRKVRSLEDGREVCLEEEVERLRRSGMSTSEIARAMGVDEGWVESLVAVWADEDSSAEDRG
jgi:hypothetical protein